MSIADVNYLKDRKEHQATAKQLLSIMEPLIRCYSGSGDEQQIAECILKFVEKQCPGWTAFSDGAEGIGNVLAVPTKYLDKTNTFASTEKLPILMAHMDTKYDEMDTKSDENATPEPFSERLSAYTFPDTIDDHGIAGREPGLTLGFDDKAGIALILHLMSTCPDPDFKVLFTVEEEYTKKENLRVCDCNGDPVRRGGGGIQYALIMYPEYFDTSVWTIMVDRAEDKPILGINGNLKQPEITKEGVRKGIFRNYFTGIPAWRPCSPHRERIEAIQRFFNPMVSARSRAKGDTYNIYDHYHRLQGRSYSSVNLAVGGYREHSKGDYLCIYETIRTLRVVEECIRRQNELYQASQLQ